MASPPKARWGLFADTDSKNGYLFPATQHTLETEKFVFNEAGNFIEFNDIPGPDSDIQITYKNTIYK